MSSRTTPPPVRRRAPSSTPAKRVAFTKGKESLSPKKTPSPPPGPAESTTLAPEEKPMLPPQQHQRSLNWFAFGDWGSEVRHLRKLAAAMNHYATTVGAPDFILLLGDNFYPSGVTSVKDDVFKRKWADVFLVYPALRVPYKVVVGNHDIVGDGKAQVMFTLSPHNPDGLWQMVGDGREAPDFNYHFAREVLHSSPPTVSAASGSDSGKDKCEMNTETADGKKTDVKEQQVRAEEPRPSSFVNFFGINTNAVRHPPRAGNSTSTQLESRRQLFKKECTDWLQEALISSRCQFDTAKNRSSTEVQPVHSDSAPVAGGVAALTGIVLPLQSIPSVPVDCWNIVYGHHPLYSQGDSRKRETQFLREKDDGLGFQTLLQAHQVDLYISGHEHAMEYIQCPNPQAKASGGKDRILNYPLHHVVQGAAVESMSFKHTAKRGISADPSAVKMDWHSTGETGFCAFTVSRDETSMSSALQIDFVDVRNYKGGIAPAIKGATKRENSTEAGDVKAEGGKDQDPARGLKVVKSVQILKKM